MLTETILETPDWSAIALPEIAERAAQATLRHLGHAPEGFEIAVLGCDDARIARLNAQFRGKDTPTDVLSWPAEDLSPDAPGAVPYPPPQGDSEDPHALGDIALAYETCARDAAALDRPLADHVCHLVIHGVLHLLGYDHVDSADAGRMEGVEIEILGKLGLPDPYSP